MMWRIPGIRMLLPRQYCQVLVEEYKVQVA